MFTSYKYPIFPDRATQQKLDEALDTCRWLYNKLLEKIDEARDKGYKLNIYKTQNMIPLLRNENPKLALVYSTALQMVNSTLWSNIKGLSALKKNGRKIGYLRFKGKGWYKTLHYRQSGFKLDQDHSRLHLSKIGDIKIKLHRRVEGRIKAVIIKKEGEQWFAIFQVEQESRPLPKTGKTVGLDVGLKSFVVDSDGNTVENPRFMEKPLIRLKNIQRKLSRTKKDSNNRKKLKDKLNKVYGKINNQRLDFLHKLSRYYINNYDAICVEDLDVKGLKEKGWNRGIHRSIHDAAWSRFMLMLSYKAESAGRKLIKVDPRNTTQRCSSCGGIVPKTLSERDHNCPYCGFSCDRDYNAARNILIAGLGQPVAPIEPRPLRHISVAQVLAMKWEVPTRKTRELESGCNIANSEKDSATE